MSAAFSLSSLEFLQGSAFDISSSPVVVVEAWATWCGPCLKSIPHLNDLATKHKGKCLFVGVSSEGADVVNPFIRKMGSSMSYPVAIDPSNAVLQKYMDQAHARGIPHAWIIEKGKIIHHSHPMEPSFASVLEEAVGRSSAFSGQGHSLGGASAFPTSSRAWTCPSCTFRNEGSQKSCKMCEGSPAPAGASLPAPPTLDESAPKTRIAVQLIDGSQQKLTVNLAWTIAQLKALIAQFGVQQFDLSTTYPKVFLVDNAQTIESAGLKNARIIQSP